MPQSEDAEDLEQLEIDAEELAQAVLRIDQSVREILEAGLSRRALVVLIKDGTKLNKGDIETVLDNLASLRDQYLTI